MFLFFLSGSCNLYPQNALRLGWKPKHDEKALFSTVGECVDFIINDTAEVVPLVSL